MFRENATIRFKVAIVFSVLAYASSFAYGAPTTWDIDGAHSTIGFSVRHMMVSNVKGSFGKVTGTVTADDKDVTKTTANAKIDATTINTANEKRDAHLKDPDFFDVAKYPEITFKSTSVKKKGKAFDLVGDLTMHGVTKPVTINVTEFTPAVKDMQGNPRRGLSGKTSINRKDFGLTWNKALEAGGVAVGDKVEINVELELVPAANAEATKEKTEKKETKS